MKQSKDYDLGYTLYAWVALPDEVLAKHRS